MLGDYGATGYGLYWRIVEMLHSNDEHTLPKEQYLFKALSRQLDVSIDQVTKFIEDCITIYKLFESDDVIFYSNRVLRNIEAMEKIKEQRSEAGRISALKRLEKSKFEDNF